MDEVTISRAIVETYTKELLDSLELDVAIVGAGPSGLAAAYYLAQAGVKVAIYERKLSIGGGIWGGGMMFNKVVVQDAGKVVLDEIGINTTEYAPDYHIADAIEMASTMCSKAVKAGTRIFNLISVEDVVIREGDRVTGLVLNWSPVEMAKLHIDPLAIHAKLVIDATGHACEICHLVINKAGGRLNTPTGTVMGEKSMWAEVAEQAISDNTVEVYPGLLVAGMAANAVFGTPRMGPIFGGMLLSGKKVAGLCLKALGK